MKSPRLTALSIDDCGRVLSAASGENITPPQIAKHLEAGAPQNPDGTVNLILYAAWLVQTLHAKQSPPTATD